jgi:hypothetical protein
LFQGFGCSPPVTPENLPVGSPSNTTSSNHLIHHKVSQISALKPKVSEIYSHSSDDGYKKVGILLSKGVNCGKDVWQGSKGGLFIYNSNNNKSYISKTREIDFF